MDYTNDPTRNEMESAWSELHSAGVEMICGISCGELQRIVNGHRDYSPAEFRMAAGLIVLRAAGLALGGTGRQPRRRVTTKITGYTVLTADFIWSPHDEITDLEHEDACYRATDWLSDNEPEHIDVSFRPVRPGEAVGTYENRPDGTLQILGYSIPIPEDVQELVNRAWEYAWQTWAE